MSNLEKLLKILRNQDSYKEYLEIELVEKGDLFRKDLYYLFIDDELFWYFSTKYPLKTKELLNNTQKLFYTNSFNAVSIAKTFQIEYKKVATFQGALTKRERQLRNK